MSFRESASGKLKPIALMCVIFSFLCLEKGFSVQIVKQETLGPGEVELVRFGVTPEGAVYPRVVLFPNQIEVRDAQGQPLAQMPLAYQTGEEKWVMVSKEGRYLARVENLWKDRFNGTQVITVYNDRGQMIQTHTWPIAEGTVSPYFEISDYDGTVAVSSGLDGFGDASDIRLHRPDGREIPYSEWPIWDFDFSSQVPLMGTIGMSVISRSASPKVSLFSLNGDPLWTQELHKENLHEQPLFVRLSPKGSFVLAETGATYKKAEGIYTAETRLYLFDKEGQLVMKRSFSGDSTPQQRANPGHVYAVDFSPQERFMGVGLLDTVIIWDLARGAEAYRVKLSNPQSTDQQILRISVNDLGEILVLTDNWEKTNVGQGHTFKLGTHLQAFLFSSDGQPLWKRTFQVPVHDRTAVISAYWLKPETQSRNDLEVLLTNQEIYLFIDNTFYHLRK